MDKTHYKELIEKYFEETITDVEIKELSDWIKNDRQLHDWWEQEFERSDSSMNPVLRDKLFARIKEETLGKEVRPLRIIPWKWVAAILLPVCVAFFTYYLLDSSPTAETPFIVKAGKGDKATIELPDGTNVVLNSASQLSYLNNFGEKVRRVQLNGEAYFKVTKNSRQPFMVRTPQKAVVKVYGTQFNVESYSDDSTFATALMEGAVKITAGNYQCQLKPNQMAYLKDGEIKVAPIEDYNPYRWREGIISFKDATFPYIIHKFEKYYGVEIRIENKAVMNYRCTGKFRHSDGVRYALRVLQKDVDFQFVRDEENHIIYIK